MSAKIKMSREMEDRDTDPCRGAIARDLKNNAGTCTAKANNEHMHF